MPRHPETEANQQPNELLIIARGRLRSPYHSGRSMSRSEMADAVNAELDNLYPDRNLGSYYVDSRWIGKLERGEHRWASNERRAALRRVTGVSADHELGLQKPRPSDRGTTAQIIRSQTSSLRNPTISSTRRQPLPPPTPIESSFEDIGSGDWSSFSRITNMLAQQRQAVAPDALLSIVEAHRDSLSTLFRKAASNPLRADIGAMLGEASIVASRLWSAQGNHTMALAHCAYARNLGDSLGDAKLGATARIFESNLHSGAATLIQFDGDVMIGLRLLHEAEAASSHLGFAAQARVAAEQAQAYASLRMAKEAQLALEKARTAAAGITAEDRAGLYSDWNSSRLQVYEGTCHILLDAPTTAIRVLEGTLVELANDRSNVNVALAARVDLSRAYALAGRLEESCAVLGDSYPQLMSAGNLRGISRALRVRQDLSRWESERPVRELDAKMKAVSPSPSLSH
ncbi:XRE family transcriptional regulator [Micromonospora sp. SH-82]|uniref:XRE family transcriptional regulator n=1 Tax=Micromonospora sp. SH-82 TaxID=3132938 RepID=UPI003EC0CCAD